MTANQPSTEIKATNARQSQVDFDTEHDPKKRSVQAACKTPLSVLVVEDTLSERLYIGQLIESYGLTVSTSSNGAEAVALFNNQHFDIVVSDWRMPEMTGLELCQKLKQQSTPPYIILLTANNQPGHTVEGIVAGADDFMTKPFAPSELKVRLLAASRIIQMQLALAEKNQALQVSLDKEQQLLDELRDDLTSAARLQQSLLPSSHYRFSGWQLNSHFQPALDLAGDIFQCFQVDQHHYGFYLLDVAGHGVASAMQGFTLAQQLASHQSIWQSLDPAKIVSQLNQNYQDPDSSGRFTTMIVGILHTKSGITTLCNAGHPQPLMNHNGHWHQLDLAAGIPLGICTNEQAKYTNVEIELGCNDKLLLFSDGAYECQHVKWGEFGVPRFVKLCDKASLLPPQQLIHHITHSLNLWQCNQAQDDVSLMLLSAPKETL